VRGRVGAQLLGVLVDDGEPGALRARDEAPAGGGCGVPQSTRDAGEGLLTCPVTKLAGAKWRDGRAGSRYRDSWVRRAVDVLSTVKL